MRTNRRVTIAALAFPLALALVAPAAADSASHGVQVAADNGTRTLRLLDLSGGPIDATTALQTGTGRAGGFIASVVDSKYDHVGYQVDATMTNLYRFDTGNYDFDAPAIPSSRVRIGAVPNSLHLADVSTLTQPVITLTGDLTGALLGGINAPLVSDLTRVEVPVQGTIAAIEADAKHLLDGTLPTLPVAVQAGSGGAFTRPASLGAGDPVTSDADATTVPVLSGSPQDVDPGDLIARLRDTIETSSTVDLIASGVLDEGSVLTAVSTALGVPVELLDKTAVLDQLSPVLTAIGPGGILGQNGTYSAAQAMTVTVPKNVPSGTYRGVLTLTLADVP